MNWYLLAYWVFGFFGALLATKALTRSAFTYGSLVACALGAWLGPVCYLAAFIWWMLNLSERNDDAISRWWNTEISRGRGDNGEERK